MIKVFVFTCIFVLAGCTAGEFLEIDYKNQKSGVELSSDKDGKVCLDDGNTHSGCLKVPTKKAE